MKKLLLGIVVLLLAQPANAQRATYSPNGFVSGPSGASYSGNVGIGTSSPASALDAWGGLSLSGKLAFSPTAPSIASGFGTSPTISGNTASFDVVVGSSPTAAGSITLPAAATAWNCMGSDITTPSQLKQTSHTTTSASFSNFSLAGVSAAFTPGDDIAFSCVAH